MSDEPPEANGIWRTILSNGLAERLASRSAAQQTAAPDGYRWVMSDRM